MNSYLFYFFIREFSKFILINIERRISSFIFNNKLKYDDDYNKVEEGMIINSD